MNQHAQAEVVAEARNVSKSYIIGERTVTVLKNINLSFRRGEFVSIMGPSGSGKSTLLNCMSGLDRASEGEIIIAGRNINEMSDREMSLFRASRMGFVFQNYALLPVFNVVENVELPALVAGVPGALARKRAMDILEFVGIQDRADFRPDQLSGGEQQRVAIARALVNEPEIIWADEPTGNLDSAGGGVVLELFRRLNRERKSTVVVVTHNEYVAGFSNRKIRIRDGLITVDTGVER
ncbi:MAG: ABC transporter ATP-binding protein [Thermoplasmata archaeon]|uniref:ABC transporter ATP-binding protein n=1 Tax=Candidatus Sysuiplasma superficiale TaxID=2823368 RepID=A0A8J8CAA1_9ARCH|nr:ABC transporter ATP-binding protein [Candidatus Sysuiplasma superficiale]MBX8643188.1 ABC transporter ATP-binding protein [Candidatus Sysuiplasma superficiale]MCL4346726.1 ABC transporter ATP-binding protein [Candidatus Thermoplasmatota archaeon]